ncbi:hypothetical protein INR49_015183 [Caranx melampygus]|nr:hypothetical protein INR49_015183 [Caranx melampygus]
MGIVTVAMVFWLFDSSAVTQLLCKLSVYRSHGGGAPVGGDLHFQVLLDAEQLLVVGLGALHVQPELGEVVFQLAQVALPLLTFLRYHCSACSLFFLTIPSYCERRSDRTVPSSGPLAESTSTFTSSLAIRDFICSISCRKKTVHEVQFLLQAVQVSPQRGNDLLMSDTVSLHRLTHHQLRLPPCEDNKNSEQLKLLTDCTAPLTWKLIGPLRSWLMEAVRLSGLAAAKETEARERARLVSIRDRLEKEG